MTGAGSEFQKDGTEHVGIFMGSSDLELIGVNVCFVLNRHVVHDKKIPSAHSV